VRRTYEVERAELGGGLVQAGVGREDRAATLSLVANDPTHGDEFVRCRVVVGVVKTRSQCAYRIGNKRVARAPSGLFAPSLYEAEHHYINIEHAHHFVQYSVSDVCKQSTRATC
jgi:hypothetical protein